MYFCGNLNYNELSFFCYCLLNFLLDDNFSWYLNEIPHSLSITLLNENFCDDLYWYLYGNVPDDLLFGLNLFYDLILYFFHGFLHHFFLDELDNFLLHLSNHLLLYHSVHVNWSFYFYYPLHYLFHFNKLGNFNSLDHFLLHRYISINDLIPFHEYGLLDFFDPVNVDYLLNFDNFLLYDVNFHLNRHLLHYLYDLLLFNGDFLYHLDRHLFFNFLYHFLHDYLGNLLYYLADHLFFHYFIHNDFLDNDLLHWHFL